MTENMAIAVCVLSAVNFVMIIAMVIWAVPAQWLMKNITETHKSLADGDRLHVKAMVEFQKGHVTHEQQIHYLRNRVGELSEEISGTRSILLHLGPTVLSQKSKPAETEASQ